MKMTFKDLLLQNKLGALADIPEGKHIGWSEEGQLELQDDPRAHEGRDDRAHQDIRRCL